MYAVSSLCRHFPYAQIKLLELGGLSVLGELFQDPEAEKLQLKAVTLLHDIIVERVGLLLYSRNNLSLFVRKPVLGVSDQVRHKPGCTATEDG